MVRDQLLRCEYFLDQLNILQAKNDLVVFFEAVVKLGVIPYSSFYNFYSTEIEQENKVYMCI